MDFKGKVAIVTGSGSPRGIGREITRALAEQEMVVEAAMERNLEKAYAAFRNDPLVNIPDSDATALFDEMVENTKAYLTEYKI